MYYQLEIQTLNDGTITVGATSTYNDSISAQISFSTKKAANLSAIKAGNLKACLIHTFGDTGISIPGMNEYVTGSEQVEPQENAANFYQMEVQTLTDGTTAIGATASYVDKIDADIAFSSKKASNLTAIQQGTLNACLIHTFDPQGNTVNGMNDYLNNIAPVESEI